MARNTRTFIDLDAAFTVNPRTRDVATKTDDNAIRGALRNLIHTRHYERPFQPDLGCQLHNLLFEPGDALGLIMAERAISDAINKHEPRVSLQSVQVTPTDSNDLYIQVVYLIKNTQIPSVFTTTFTRIR
jgi:phage baseplate assembly protein W